MRQQCQGPWWFRAIASQQWEKGASHRGVVLPISFYACPLCYKVDVHQCELCSLIGIHVLELQCPMEGQHTWWWMESWDWNTTWHRGKWGWCTGTKPTAQDPAAAIDVNGEAQHGRWPSWSTCHDQILQDSPSWDQNGIFDGDCKPPAHQVWSTILLLPHFVFYPPININQPLVDHGCSLCSTNRKTQ